MRLVVIAMIVVCAHLPSAYAFYRLSDGTIASRLNAGIIVRGGPIPVWRFEALRGEPQTPPPEIAHGELLLAAASVEHTGVEFGHMAETMNHTDASVRSRAISQNEPTNLAQLSSGPNGQEVAYTLEVTKGQRLSMALKSFLNRHRIALQWNARADFRAQQGYRIDGDSVESIVKKALDSYDLSATYWEGNQVLEVRLSDGALTR